MNYLQEEHRRHVLMAKSILDAPHVTDAAAERAQWHLDQADGLKARIDSQETRQPISADGSIGIGDRYSGKGFVPEHQHVLTHEQKVADLPGLGRKVDPEAAFGWLGMTFKNQVSPQDPALMDRWNKAAGIQQKDMATSGSAGTLIPAPIAAFLIDLMRANVVTGKLGASFVPMTASTLKVNRQTSDVTASWLAEAAAVTFSDAALDSVTLTARRLEAGTKVSQELAEDSSDPVDAGQVVATSIGKAIALELDRVALRGSGTAPEPRGIKNVVGVQTFAMGANGAAASYGTLNTLQSMLAGVNVLGNGYVLHPRTLYAIGGDLDTTNQPKQPPATIHEPWSRSQSTTALPTNLVKGTSGAVCTELYAGDWSELLIGMRIGLTIDVLRELFRANGQIGLVGRVRADVAVKHATSFVVVSDVTN